jgi:hypothetical protein
MKTKLLEIRDEGTCIPVMAFRLESTNEAERWILARSGYGKYPWDHAKHVAVWPLSGGRNVCTTDPFEHQIAGRTLLHAHQFIEQHFDELLSGDVVDVWFILGEKEAPSVSDRFYRPVEKARN